MYGSGIKIICDILHVASVRRTLCDFPETLSEPAHSCRSVT